MNSELNKSGYDKWLRISTYTLFFIFCASMCAPAFPYYWHAFYGFIYKTAVIVLTVFFLYFNGKNLCIEMKLLLLTAAWFALTRMLNGDVSLYYSGEELINVLLPLLLLPVCVILPEGRRKKTLQLFCSAVCLAFTLSAIIGIYIAVTRKMIINPFSESVIWDCVANSRMTIFSMNPNSVGFWHMTGVALSIYLFLSIKKPAVRVFTAVAILLNYTGLALTASRNSMLGLSLTAAAVTAMLIIRRYGKNNMGRKWIIIILSACLIMPAAYMSFGWTRSGISYLAESYAEKNTDSEVLDDIHADAQDEAENADAEDNKVNSELYEDKRSIMQDTGRLRVYKSAFLTMQYEPQRLLKGCLRENLMTISNKDSEKKLGDFHNSLLSILLLTGIPGFLLELGFLVLLAVKTLRLFLTDEPGADPAVKSLAAFMPALYLHNMLESSIFIIMDVRSLTFFLIAGAVIGYSDEICPLKKKLK